MRYSRSKDHLGAPLDSAGRLATHKTRSAIMKRLFQVSAPSIPMFLLVCAVAASEATAQVITRASVSYSCAAANADCQYPTVSPGGRFIAFMSNATNLVPGGSAGLSQVFVLDRVAGVTRCASVTPIGVPGFGNSFAPARISNDGRWLVFSSAAIDLVSGDTNGHADVFLRDLQQATTHRIGLGPGNLQGNGISADPAISGDGRFIVFDSFANNLVPGDTNNQPDIFLWDRDPDGNGVFDEGNETLARINLGPGGIEADGDSRYPSISDDGRRILYSSYASDIVPGTTSVPHVYLYDRIVGGTRVVDVDSSGASSDGPVGTARISGDGRFVTFDSRANNLVPGDTNGAWDIFVRDLQTGAIERASVDSMGHQSTFGSFNPSISSDGRFVAFESDDDFGNPPDAFSDVFVRDRMLGTTTRVQASPDLGPNANSYLAEISPDGDFIAFESKATDLQPDFVNGFQHAYLYEQGLVVPTYTSFCAGDGSGGACPCGNSGTTGHGCENSSGTGGALLTAIGSTHPDLVRLVCAHVNAGVPAVFLQGTQSIAPVAFGDGLSCIGGTVNRLATVNALGTTATYTSCPNQPITTRSAALGDPIAPGSTRYYATFYRDTNASYCPPPSGNAWNMSQAIAITW
jgi:Tol biopolymer transport system component